MDEKSLIRLLEKLSAHTEFRTLKKGLPDPPMDVRVDPGPQDGTVLVTWIPVTLNNQVNCQLSLYLSVSGVTVCLSFVSTPKGVRSNKMNDNQLH